MKSIPLLNIADNRALWFEAIRDLSDPLLKNTQRNTPLTSEDYLPSFNLYQESEATLNTRTLRRAVEAFKENNQIKMDGKNLIQLQTHF